MDAPTVALATLGCKVNIAEGEALLAAFRQRGFVVVPDESAADVYVINTCTVTATADHKSRQAVRQAVRANPTALVAATGCYVSVAGRPLHTDFPGNVLIAPNRDKQALVERVAVALAERTGTCTALAQRPDTPLANEAPLQPAALAMDNGRTRAFLKVQDGCNAGCAFCIIPRARGGPRSVPLSMVIESAQTLYEQGFGELVISGILLGSYGHDLPGRPTLATLIERLLLDTRFPRLRISSLEPQDVDRAWLDLWREPRLCRHLHLPLQSGSATTLQAMRRLYTPSQYARLVDDARAAIPSLTLTTDVMVGYPTETAADFAESYRFMASLGFADMHIFTYSPRPGTAAARLPDAVTGPDKRARSQTLHALAGKGRAGLARQAMGTVVDVLWEYPPAGSAHAHGLTDTYLRVHMKGEILPSPRTSSRCRVLGPTEDGKAVWAAPCGTERSATANV